MDEVKPQPNLGQLEHDRHFLKTSRHYKDAAHGTAILLLHDLGDFARKKSSDRWYRVWKRDRIRGWVFEEMQFGNRKTSE